MSRQNFASAFAENPTSQRYNGHASLRVSTVALRRAVGVRVDPAQRSLATSSARCLLKDQVNQHLSQALHSYNLSDSDRCSRTSDKSQNYRENFRNVRKVKNTSIISLNRQPSKLSSMFFSAVNKVDGLSPASVFFKFAICVSLKDTSRDRRC